MIKMYEEMVLPSIDHGLCGCIYTQLSDIEDEINGLYTYDRQVCKVNKQRLLKLQNKFKKHLRKRKEYNDVYSLYSDTFSFFSF